MYFTHLPKIRFQVSPAGYQEQAQYVTLTDITVNVRFIKKLIDNITLFDYYNLRDGETLEKVSENLYGSPHYNWVLMLLNDIYDYRRDYIMDSQTFEHYISSKYGSVAAAKQFINHYVDSRGLIVNHDNHDIDGELDVVQVYAYDYENEINESRRTIKVVSQNLLNIILQHFREALK